MRLYDTMTRAVVDIRPRESGRLTMYSCGPTVYRYAHIGNLRTFLMADLIRRAFRYAGVEVHQIQNITDVGHMTDELFDRGEDKMLVAAGIENKSPAEIADHYTAAFLADVDAIGIERAARYPKASDHIPHMIRIIAQLIERGHAYVADGTVYFDAASFPDYGRLSGNTLAQLQTGHRKDIVDPNKRHHADFVLWMSAGPNRMIKFPSPWGEGYPGWHIECSAMSMEHLGEHFDVHTGGEDNVFPHHEDEIAQSDGATGHQVVGHWIHGAHLLSEGRKMAKSAGNFYDLRDLAAMGHTDPLAVRLLFLHSRYRAQMNFTRDALKAAETTLKRWRRHAGDWSQAPATSPADAEHAYEKRFADALADDLDTPSAVAAAADVISTDALAPDGKARLLARWDRFLGLDLMRDAGETGVPPAVADLVESRRTARAAKDYAGSDRIRDAIRAHGYDVEDTPDGQVTRRIR